MTVSRFIGAGVIERDRAAEEPITTASTAATRGYQRLATAVAEIAAHHAAEVDREARFPREALDMARRERLLGMMVPERLGGEGATTADVVDICYRLGRACSATAMIFAMHQVKVACLIRYGQGHGWHEDLLRRLCSEQLLFASSTTEGRNGGNIRSSDAPIQYLDGRITLDRDATVISYGAEADGIVTTARRSADAAPSDQVLVVFLKQDYSLTPTVPWSTLGMRGTCSTGFALKASGLRDQILPVAYERIHAQTMVPSAHLMWGAVWAGIAAGAVARAQTALRTAARKSGATIPPGAVHLVKASSDLAVLRNLIAGSLLRYEQAMDDEHMLSSMDFQTRIGLTKVEASELAVSIVLGALRACGLSGYRCDGPQSVERHVRDVLSSPLMINNDRIIANIGANSLLTAVPAGLTG
jgi:acyl-CoA dehydrogenase